MKISIAWLFDHIDADWQKIDIQNLVDRFNKTTAEIEGVSKITVNFDILTFAHIMAVEKNIMTVKSNEWNVDCSLPVRPDLKKGDWALIAKDGKNYRWAVIDDLGGQKEGFLPAMHCDDETLYAGDWKKVCEKTDYILKVDNKSITHRPDMWGHRGFAREIAAILDLSLKPLESFLTTKKTEAFATKAPAPDSDSFGITIKDTKGCKRFAGLYVKKIDAQSSLFWMAYRLTRVDARPINALVDITNYVMLDMSQPMHAFDADALKEKDIIIRCAKNKEKITLLDDETLELTADDILVCDGKTPISLAGIMGGKSSGINAQTESIFLESANFDATTIRRTSTYHKKRTAASARFEKSLDPNQNVTAITRFLNLCDNASINYTASGNIISLGAQVKPHVIIIAHAFIEQRLGATMAPDFVVKTLQKLLFEVEQKQENDTIIYHITVPSFRATKDVHIPEDIVEEIGRFFGYDNIEQALPYLQLKPRKTKDIMRTRAIKKLLVHAGAMREIHSYSFYDESFLRKLAWEPKNTVRIKNPVSENWQQMVTSLIPHLYKALEQNVADYDQLRFFEWARTWQQTGDIEEKKVLAGIIFDKKKPVDFYDAKVLLQKLFDMLRIEVTWQRVDAPKDPWFLPYQTAHLMYAGNRLGVAGIADTRFLHNIAEGHAFIFELDGDQLLTSVEKPLHFESLSKYPEVVRDVSMLIARRYTVDEIAKLIATSDERIAQVKLVDFFEKKEWEDKKSVTFRFVLRDQEKTMTKKDVDDIWDIMVHKLEKLGATVR